MNNIKINEDNCVLDASEINKIDEWFDYYREFSNENYKRLKESDTILSKIIKLNEMVKELHARNLSVETIVKFHEIGKQAEEKQK